MTEDVVSKPTYYAILPASVRYDTEITASEKIFFAEITVMTNKRGYCYASNNYFAELYDVYPSTISRWVNHLQERGYIEVEYIKEGKEVVERHIKLSEAGSALKQQGSAQMQQGVVHECNRGSAQMPKEILQEDNITSKNNINNNNAKALSDSELSLAIQNEEETRPQVVKYWIEHLPKSKEFIDALLKWYSTQKKKPSIWQLQNKLDKLYKMYSTEKDQIECVLQSAVEGWIGFFEIKNKKTSSRESEYIEENPFEKFRKEYLS